MKKILDYRCYISTDGKHYFDTSIRYHLTYTEPKEQKVTVIMTFDDLVRVVKNGAIMNAELTHTFFRRKPMVELRQGWDNDYFVSIFYRNLCDAFLINVPFYLLFIIYEL
jgi:hypothetical protein